MFCEIYCFMQILIYGIIFRGLKMLQKKIFKFFFCTSLLSTTLLFSENFSSSSNFSNHLYFLIQKGQIHKAISLYKEKHRDKKHDLEVLQQIGLGLLQAGCRSKDAEIIQLSLLGAGVSLNEKAIPILEAGLTSNHPYHQLVSLSFLSKYQNKEADRAFEQALRSPYLPIRLEAAFHLCTLKSNIAYGQTESLMHKAGVSVKQIFPQFFAAIGDVQSLKILKQLLYDSNLQVRIETILNIIKHGHDELLPMIRILAKHPEEEQKEVCAMALGKFQDQNSIPTLEILAQSKAPSVRLSALYSLYLLGQKECLYPILEAARCGNLFAINLLGKIDGNQEVLAELIVSKNLDVRINAALALLELKDVRSIKPLLEILIKDSKDLLILPIASLGKSLLAFKIISSASQTFKKEAAQFELSLKIREEILVKCLDLPEEHFIQLIKHVLNYEQKDLVPIAIKLLENMQSKEAINLLITFSQKAGAPLIRNYCNLSLYKIGEVGPYFDHLKDWILTWRNVELIRFRPVLPLTMRQYSSGYEMNPEETSRLLIETFESFVQLNDDRGIDILLNVIQNSNNNNKFVLAGLLMRATL